MRLCILPWASLFLIVCGSGCGTGTSAQPASTNVAISADRTPTATAAPSSSPAASATASPEAPATATAVASATASATATSTISEAAFGFIGVPYVSTDWDPKGPRSKVTVGKAQVGAELSADVVTRLIQSYEVHFKACHQRGLRNNPALAGSVSLKLTILTSGGAKVLSTAGSSLPDSAVVACVAGTFGIVVFPRPDNPAPVSVTIDLTP